MRWRLYTDASSAQGRIMGQLQTLPQAVTTAASKKPAFLTSDQFQQSILRRPYPTIRSLGDVAARKSARRRRHTCPTTAPSSAADILTAESSGPPLPPG